MELRTNAINTVSLEGAENWPVSATWDKDGVPSGPLVPTYANGLWSVNLPYLVEEGTVDIHWTFTITGSGTFNRTDRYEVTTPYLTVREIQTLVPNASQADAIQLEQTVRHIINAHTGQSFGKRTKALLVTGDGNDSLALPERLISFTRLNQELHPYDLYNTATYGDDPEYFLGRGFYVVTGDGWYIKSTRFSEYNVKADYTVDITTTGPIRDPWGGSRHFYDDVNYMVEGTWGWESVPIGVRSAAYLLANDYACNEQLYRDRYLTSMTAADWRIQFNGGAFRRTGNARADHLLAPYVLRRGWAVI